MAIGYIGNLANLQQGNQQVVNSMANLGQQISNSIETHAQLQAAQTMLPALQQSYSQGMQKIASGDPNGMADIYGAAATASQIPVLQGFAQHALTTAQSANINAQHMARTQAFLQGKSMGLMASHPEMYNSDGTLNTSRLGQAAPAKPMTAFQQQSLDQKANALRAKQVGLNSTLWNGQQAQGNNPASEGASTAYDNILANISNGETPSQADLSKFASAYSQYKKTRGALRNAGIEDANFENAYQQLQSQIPALQGIVEKEGKKKPNMIEGFFGMGGPDQAKINLANQQIQKIKQLGNVGGTKVTTGGLPSATGGTAQNTSTQAIMQAVQAAKLHPDKVDLIKSRLKGAGIDPSMLDQAIQSQQAQQQSAPQASMIPAASSVASTEEENTSPESETE